MARATPFLLAFFSAAAAILLVVTGLSLLIPGGPLDAIWRMAESKHALLLPYGGLAGSAFLLLAIVAVVASVGCYRRRRWGWGMRLPGSRQTASATPRRFSPAVPLRGSRAS